MSSALSSILNVPQFRGRFDLLRRHIEAEPAKVVPWIGAGLSKPFGLPLWREFLEIAAKRLEPEEKAVFEQLDNLADIDLSLVAEFLHSRLGGRLRQEVVESFNKSRRWSPVDCIIPWLGVQKIITTNYDRVLDSLLPWLTPVSAATAASDFQDLRCLIKLHGRVEEPDSIVLTRSQYVRAYSDHFWGWLEQFSLSNKYLFLGCSLTEDDFLGALRPVGKEGIPRHFAIIPTKSNSESRERSIFLSRTYGIETISYDPDEHGHGVVRELLLELVPSLRMATKQVQNISSEAELELAWSNYKLAIQRGEVDRKDKVEYLRAILEVAQSSLPESEIREKAFRELLNHWQDEAAWSALLESAKESHQDTARVLQQRERLRPLFDKNTQSLPESTDIPVRNYYREFRAGAHVSAEKWLTTLKHRSNSDRDRIAVLRLQNSLLGGNLSTQLMEEFEKNLSNNGKHLYLDYGLGLFYLWKGELERARKRFKSARAPWTRGKSAFISWQEAICEILSRDFMTARVKLEAVAVGAFLPLGPAGDLIRRSGGAELSMDLRRTTSKELYCLVWFLRSLAAKAMNLGDEASAGHDSTVQLIESVQEDDLLLDWLRYAARLLKEQSAEPLRIELEHRTRQSPGIQILLNAVCVLMTAISPKAGAKYSSSIAAAIGNPTLPS